MKRHRRDPEAQPRHHEDHRHQAELRMRLIRQPLEKIPERLQVAHPGRSIKERQPVKQQTGSENAQEEILHRRFLRGRVAPREVENHVRRHADQLETHEQENHVIRGRHDHRPGAHDQQRSEKLPRPRIARLAVRHSQQDQSRKQQHSSGIERQIVVQRHRGIEIGVRSPQPEERHKRRQQRHAR